MALRDWTVSRLATIWAAWFLFLLTALVIALGLSPEGVHIQVSPPETRGALRWVFAVAGGLGLALPPAIVTYLWYLARLRVWSRGESTTNAASRK
jgi:hypothetical protein